MKNYKSKKEKARIGRRNRLVKLKNIENELQTLNGNRIFSVTISSTLYQQLDEQTRTNIKTRNNFFENLYKDFLNDTNSPDKLKIYPGKKKKLNIQIENTIYKGIEKELKRLKVKPRQLNDTLVNLFLQN